jgi:hypothetical protein
LGVRSDVGAGTPAQSYSGHLGPAPVNRYQSGRGNYVSGHIVSPVDHEAAQEAAQRAFEAREAEIFRLENQREMAEKAAADLLSTNMERVKKEEVKEEVEVKIEPTETDMDQRLQEGKGAVAAWLPESTLPMDLHPSNAVRIADVEAGRVRGRQVSNPEFLTSAFGATTHRYLEQGLIHGDYQTGVRNPVKAKPHNAVKPPMPEITENPIVQERTEVTELLRRRLVESRNDELELQLVSARAHMSEAEKVEYDRQNNANRNYAGPETGSASSSSGTVFGPGVLSSFGFAVNALERERAG